MRVIDLLNKIANGEEVPKKIKVYEHIYTLDRDSLNYMCGEDDWLAFIDGNELNTYEVEIIEEDKKIEKLSCLVDEDGELTIEGFAFDREQKIQIVNKINEIIDYINKGDK